MTRAIWVIVATLLLLYLATIALAEDYWTNCEQAYQFCTKRPYHRDCSIWTAHGKPLSVNRSYYPAAKFNPNAHTPFCAENPWHQSCGYLSEMPALVQEHIECPIPKAKCECKDLPPTYQGSGSSRSSTPAPCVCP